MAAKKKAAGGSDAAVAAINKKFAAGSVRAMSEGSGSDLHEVMPTGVDVIDNWAIGCGGLPSGRIIEVYSGEGVGKTSFGFACLAAAQRTGGIGVLYETERSLVPERADIFGVDRSKIVLGEPETMNDLLAQVKELLAFIPKGVGPNVIVWDSLAATPTEKEVAGKPQPGDHARQMSSNLRLIAPMLHKHRTCLIVINQTRSNIGVIFGDSTTTPGGSSLGFYASIRLAMWRGSAVKEGPDVVGHRITLKAVKNKLAYPQRKVSLRLDYRYGFDDEWSTIDFAKERALIPKGARMTPATYARSMEALAGLPGWYPNVFDPTAKTGEPVENAENNTTESDDGLVEPGDSGTDSEAGSRDSSTEGASDASERGHTAGPKASEEADQEASKKPRTKKKTARKKKKASKGRKSGKEKE